jgi:hypothetical protein
MKGIETRVYNNLMLTVIAIFLALLVLRPVLDIGTPAYAQRDRTLRSETGGADSVDWTTTGGDQQQAAAQREIAGAIRDLASAIKESQGASAEAQTKIADAIRSLGSM